MSIPNNKKLQKKAKAFKKMWYAKYKIPLDYILTNQDDLQAYADDWQTYRNNNPD